MVIDSSALVAILLREPEAMAFTDAILAASLRMVSAPSYLETAMVLFGRLGPTALGVLDHLIDSLGLDTVPFDARQAQRAAAAFLRYGKGHHPAGLNFGDCCSYALAAEADSPLLFKGDDFARTDAAVAPLP